MTMTEQIEQPKTVSAKLTVPEGEVIIRMPASLGIGSAHEVREWLLIAANLEGVEVRL